MKCAHFLFSEENMGKTDISCKINPVHVFSKMRVVHRVQIANCCRTKPCDPIWIKSTIPSQGAVHSSGLRLSSAKSRNKTV